MSQFQSECLSDLSRGWGWRFSAVEFPHPTKYDVEGQERISFNSEHLSHSVPLETRRVPTTNRLQRIYHQQDETDMPSLKRPGRQRTLLLMNNSDRAKYYRRINAELSIRREARVDFLRREVQRLEMQLQIIRLFDQLPTPLGSSTTTDCLAHAITKRLDESGRTLQDGRARVLKVAVVGASEAPIVRLEYVVRGRLQSHLVRRLYEFIVGNTVALEKMMFEEIEYGCTCFFHFSNDGIIERVDSESDEVNALREFLGSLRVLGPALLQMREVLV